MTGLSETEVPSEAVAPETVETEQRDFTAEAKNMGWHDPNDDDFKGDKENALDAQAFVEKGENELPLLRSNQKTMTKNMTKMQKKLDAQEQANKQFGEYMNNIVEQKNKELDVLKRQAVEDGDTATYDRIDKEQKDLKPVPVSSPQGDLDGAIERFKASNPWFGTDTNMTYIAQGIDSELQASNPNMSFDDRFAEVARRVNTSPSKPQAPSTQSPRKRASPSSTKGFNDLPSHAQEMCDKWVANGLVKDRAAYIKNFKF